MNLDPLYDAAIAGDADARAKLEMEADKLDGEGYTILHIEARKGNAERVRFILREFAHKNLLTKITLSKQTALHLAIYGGGHTEVAEVLIHAARDLPPPSFQAFLRQADEDGDTALHAAVKKGQVDIVKLLVEADPTDTHIQNDDGKTPMYIAVEKGYNDMVEIISTTCTAPSLDGPYGDTVVRIDDPDQVKRPGGTLYEIKSRYAFYDAAIAGDAEAIAKLEMQADKLDYYDQTILHAESRRGKTECVRFLLKEFANKNLLVKLSRAKHTALHLAILKGHTEVVEVLIEAARGLPPSSFQAFLRQGDYTMDTALHLAVKYGQVDIVKLLVEADPTDRHSQNHKGKTPMYIAVEKGFNDIVEIICTTCTAPSLEGPGGTTALHAAVSNIDKAKQIKKDVIGMIINAAKRWGTPQESFEDLFTKTDGSGRTVLELAAMAHHVNVVDLIILEDPAYKAIDEDYNNIVELLSKNYEVAVYERRLALILAIKKRDKGSVLRLLHDDKELATFVYDKGWTPLHYAAFYEIDSVLDAIIEAQKDLGYQFIYQDTVQTPLLVAAERGYTSTVIRLMELWPTSSPAYTAINSNGQNILHLAAAENKKEMIQGILKYCPEKYKDKILKQQDVNGDTPLHLLISHGCYIPELIKHRGLDTIVRNKRKWTPRDMLYSTDDIIADQVKIKIALDDVQTKQSWKFWLKNKKKKIDISESWVPPSKRETKDKKFTEHGKSLMDQKRAQMKNDLERYKKRTSTQIVVATLITTVTFTVGFTMPGGLHQSGEVDEGLVVLTKKAAFNAFMVSDALAFLLSTCSLFLYFLESMYEDPHQVSKLNAASVGLNIVSVMAMMLTFITGTYVVLSHSAAIAITVCLIGSFFFIFVIVLLIKMVYDRQVKRNED